jgi:hypothetical protein
MSDGSPSRTAEVAAQQVEAIVAAAQVAAAELQRQAERDAEKIRDAGRRDVKKEIEAAHNELAELSEKARHQAKELIDDAEKESAQLREQTRRQVQARTAAAEEAAEQVLSDARALSTGLRRLGEILGDQGERLMRDVQAAHRRMQADLRVGPPDSDIPSEPVARRSRTSSSSSSTEAPDSSW